MVLEKNRVQTELRVHQGHIAEPASKGVYTLLSLGKVLRVRPGGHVGALRGGTEYMTNVNMTKILHYSSV